MGSGSSRTRKESRQTQFSSSSKETARTPSLPMIPRHDSYDRRPYSSQPTSWITNRKIHIPPSHNTLAHYASVWEQNGKLSSKFEELIRSESIKIENNQKEIHNHQLVTKHSSTCNTALVESTLTSQVQSTHNLSKSEKIDSFIFNLKQTHIDFDETVKRRIQQITTETESILTQILEETQQSQQQLLKHAKEQQLLEDEKYRKAVEEFIAQLDEKRAKQLAFIQGQLQEQRLIIFNESQLKFRAVSEQANSIKNQIMIEEERKASEKIDSIVTEMNSISRESTIQHLGAEIKTNINLILHETVGSNNIQLIDYDHSNKQEIIKKTTYITNDNINQKISSANHQTKLVKTLVKQNTPNITTKSQQPQ